MPATFSFNFSYSIRPNQEDYYDILNKLQSESDEIKKDVKLNW